MFILKDQVNREYKSPFIILEIYNGNFKYNSLRVALVWTMPQGREIAAWHMQHQRRFNETHIHVLPSKN